MEMRKALSFIFIMLSLLAIGCAGYQASSDRTPISIKTDRVNYTPLMSSTVGIGLTPEYPLTIANGTVSFCWHTDYGYFISWKAPDFKVHELGPDVTTDDGKIYWSYSPDNIDKDKPPVRVTLTMVDKATGKAINTTGLDIGWENKDFARVLDQ
jgi:hypothetical protein